MGRLAWSQAAVPHRPHAGAGAGVLLATTAFTVLTAASRTAQLRTVGTVSAHFVPAYDILVRPKGARTALETQTGTVQPNFLSGIYGGITMAQYHQIQQSRGPGRRPDRHGRLHAAGCSCRSPVPAAALAGRPPAVPGNHHVDRAAARAALLSRRPTSTSRRNGSRGAQTATGTDGTGRASVPLRGRHPEPASTRSAWPRSRTARLVQGQRLRPRRPLGQASRRTTAGYCVNWTIPVLIAAMDPVAEAKLDGLNKAVVSGRYLTENRAAAARQQIFPVLASSVSGMSEYAQTSLRHWRHRLRCLT